ncbi:class I SAM-dependent methyltransferase [Mycolicibacterium arseniciresistens]|uniref:Class I SAM-dependent methyltransferase n=1 Tax=Mycolicibacterium arseniciresistens TaxID=3062257 RepID=A0ABT8UHC7_9MYCO|nr:class I SAM-dependent methyltransferase [Mycolicibacterium arseniciresistens]MDO3636210.1 class I SAM-dependent methyltransferase [Mycolicibacterium arseniciresistens]
MSDNTSVFHQLQFADDYADNPPKFVPGYREIHRLAAILIAERAPEQARVLVLGAGGGLEIKALAEARPGWSFDGVDPARPMLDLAAKTLGPLTSRARLHEGYIDDAPAGPFDAATSFLTLHFLGLDERRRTAAEVRRRLAPGAPFVVAHMSLPQRDAAERGMWLSRYAEYAHDSGISREITERARATVDSDVPILTPEQDEAVLRDAGFTDVVQFYSAFTFRGWVGYA